MALCHTPVRVPALYCPFQFRSSPVTEEIDQDAQRWMDRFGLFADARQREYFRSSHFGRFIGFSVPDGRPGPLRTAAAYCGWVFAFDDAVSDESGGAPGPGDLADYLARLARMLEAPQAPAPIGDKWAAALLDLRLALDRYGTPAQVHRWVEQIRDYFTGLVWESAVREGVTGSGSITASEGVTGSGSGELPGLNDYVMLWQKSSGILPALALMEIAQERLLTAEQLHDPRVRVLQDISVTLLGWSNDITSYNKEAFRERRFGFPASLNLVPVLAREYRIPMDEASVRAADLHDRAMHRLAGLGARLRGRGGPGLARYVGALEQLVRGGLEWQVTTDRYQDPNDPGETVAPRVSIPGIRSTPAAPLDPGPPDIPAIAWWWDQP